MEDAVVVTKSKDGKAQLHQGREFDDRRSDGGGFCGMLIGVIFLNPLVGAAVGAASSAISGRLTDIGISDKR